MAPQLHGKAKFLTAAYGDHKGVLFDVQGGLVEGRAFARVPTKRFTCPCDMSISEWRSALEAAWSSIVTEVPAEDTLTPDQEWEWFNTALEKVFVLTQKDANNAHTRPKGSGPVLVPSHDTRVGGFRHGSYRERTLRKLLGRIHEANRQFYAAGKCVILF